MSLIKLSDKSVSKAVKRTFELKLETQSDIRVALAFVHAQLIKCNREARSLWVETWEEYYDEPQPERRW